MRKWRPSYRCIYIIPEVLGNLNALEIILNRVLPLRKFQGQEDILVMLGGYIDGTEDGGKVIDTLITIKQEYGDRFIPIRGDNEQMMLGAVEGSSKDYDYWIENGGVETISGYLKTAGIRSEASSLPQNRLKDIVPKTHIDFLKSLPFFYSVEGYMFIHGGFAPGVPLDRQNPTTFAFDRSANRLYKRAWNDPTKSDVEKLLNDDRVVIGSHNSSKNPVIYPRYLMLGGLGPKSLICGDLNSMEFVKVKTGKSRIYKTNIKVYE